MIKKNLFYLLFLMAGILATACGGRTTSESVTTQTTPSETVVPALASPPAVTQQLVLPGDYADPSVTKVGNTYWATATSSEWGPLFPLLRSTDLKTWETVGHVFPEKLPEWAEAHFWAPEIAYENGKTYIYYTAKKKGGPLCVGVASAPKPAGPYTDHGALICQEVGAIDGFPIRDENGQLYLVWKEDGNSRDRSTPIWAQRMNEERTALEGEMVELFRNDPNTWEGRLVEGPAIVRRGEYFYTFYAGDACCGRECTYAQGVARSRNLLGPWQKYANNPIIKSNDAWKCPGHGTVITDAAGNDFLLYHGYSTDGSVYTGRQGLLSGFTWTADGWPQFYTQTATASTSPRNLRFSDEFSATALPNTWQWPVAQQPNFSLQQDLLRVSAQPNRIGAVLGQRTPTDTYVATAALQRTALPKGVQAGIAAIGDLDNALGVAVLDNQIILWQTRRNKQQVLAQANLPAGGQALQLRLTATDGNRYQGAWSTDGSTWNELKPESGSVNGDYLPPWDRAVRIGLTAKGPATATAAFDWFRVEPYGG